MILCFLFAQAAASSSGNGVLDLLKLIPDGLNVVAVIVVVVLFLKQQDKFNSVLKDLSDENHRQYGLAQKAFQDQISELTRQYAENQKTFQTQIQTVIDAHMRVSSESITALKAVENTVRELRDNVFRNK